MPIIKSKIAGISFGDRQKNAETVNVGDVLEHIHVPNPHHMNAIMLYKDNKELGFIKRELADEYRERIYQVKVLNVNKKELIGINIEVELA